MIVSMEFLWNIRFEGSKNDISLLIYKKNGIYVIDLSITNASAKSAKLSNMEILTEKIKIKNCKNQLY